MLRQAHSNNPLLDVWEVSIFKLPAAVDYHLLFLQPCQQKSVPWEFTHSTWTVCVCPFSVSLGWLWVIQIPWRALIPLLVDLAPFRSSVSIFEVTWTPLGHLRLFKFYPLLFLFPQGVCSWSFTCCRGKWWALKPSLFFILSRRHVPLSQMSMSWFKRLWY